MMSALSEHYAGKECPGDPPLLKSNRAMRDRVRELMNSETDDYDRAVECVLDDFETVSARITELEAELSTANAEIERLRTTLEESRAILLDSAMLTQVERIDDALSASIEQGKVLDNEVQVLREALEPFSKLPDTSGLFRIEHGWVGKARSALAQVSGSAPEASHSQTEET